MINNYKRPFSIEEVLYKLATGVNIIDIYGICILDDDIDDDIKSMCRILTGDLSGKFWFTYNKDGLMGYATYNPYDAYLKLEELN